MVIFIKSIYYKKKLNYQNEKEILLLSSLVSLSIVFFIGFPNDKNVEDKKALIQKQFELNNPPSSEIFGVEMLLAFDLVRLEPTGDVIMAGKTKPQIKIDIFDKSKTFLSYFRCTW